MELTLGMLNVLIDYKRLCYSPEKCVACLVINECADLKSWFAEQETRLKPQPKPVPTVEPHNNFKACLIPTRFAKHDCAGCHQYQACVFTGKEQYSRYRL